MHSVESAISSLVTSEYFMPTWPMAIPSQTAIAGNMTGMPPASATPSLTACAILSRFMWPGIISLYEQTIPIIGFFISSFVKPSALKRLLCGACWTPSFTLSLNISVTSIDCGFLPHGLKYAYSIIYACGDTSLAAISSPMLLQLTARRPFFFPASRGIRSALRMPSSSVLLTAFSIAPASAGRPNE